MSHHCLEKCPSHRKLVILRDHEPMYPNSSTACVNLGSVEHGGALFTYWLSTSVATFLLESLLVDKGEVSMPGQEVTSAVDRTTVVGVNDNEVVKSGLGSWVQCVVHL